MPSLAALHHQLSAEGGAPPQARSASKGDAIPPSEVGDHLPCEGRLPRIRTGQESAHAARTLVGDRRVTERMEGTGKRAATSYARSRQLDRVEQPLVGAARRGG